jgi:hypothetical protein
MQINKFAQASKLHNGLISEEIYKDRLDALQTKNPKIKNLGGNSKWQRNMSTFSPKVTLPCVNFSAVKAQTLLK